jgi:glutamyl/glutaminyl-tRNA synthetase
VLLRLEDHDRGRCRPQYESAILEDLEWLGLEPDVGLSQLRVLESGFRQSDRNEIYISAVEHLRAAGHVYSCNCTRKNIAEDAAAPALEQRYSGRCRNRGLESGKGLGLRLMMEEAQERFTDLLLGSQSQQPAQQCGDLLLRDRLDNWTYQFAVTVDDLDQGIDLVIRGEDLLASTGRQVRLARLLGRERPPVFLHHGLIRRPDGSKLSKANQDTAVRELRTAGMTPAALLGQVAFRAGLVEQPVDLPPGELQELFLPHVAKLKGLFSPGP